MEGNGELKARGELYQIKAYLIKMGAHRVGLEIDDLSLEIWKHVREDRKRRITWVYVRSRVIDAMRAQKQRRIHERASACGESSEDQGLRALELKDSLNHIIGSAELGVVEKKLLYLRFYQDMTLEEIARTLSWPKTTVIRRLGKVLDGLREFLLDEGDE